MPSDLAALLAKAVPSPRSLHTKDGGDALVLALHCLMVHDGFVAVDADNTRRPGCSPPADWRQFEQQWVITYARPGAARPFRMHCSLQAATGRLFVHASEVSPSGPVEGNIQLLGLQVQNYTDAERCAADSWEGAIQNEQKLAGMFQEHVLLPLWAHAEKGAPSLSPLGAQTSWPGLYSYGRETLRTAATSQTVVAAVVVGLAAATAATYVWSRHRRA